MSYFTLSFVFPVRYTSIGLVPRVMQNLSSAHLVKEMAIPMSRPRSALLRVRCDLSHEFLDWRANGSFSSEVH